MRSRSLAHLTFNGSESSPNVVEATYRTRPGWPGMPSTRWQTSRVGSNLWRLQKSSKNGHTWFGVGPFRSAMRLLSYLGWVSFAIERESEREIKNIAKIDLENFMCNSICPIYRLVTSINKNMHNQGIAEIYIQS